MINLVVATSTNNIIGKNNQLLWHLPNDMKFFKNTTWAMPVIMGRKTFESLGRPLPGRTNIVITSNQLWKMEGAIVVNNLDAAIAAAKATDAKEMYIVGGGEIYRQTMGMAERIYLTRVHAEFDGDTSFPVLSLNEWKLHSCLDFPQDEKHAYAYSFEIWNRIKN